MPGFSMAALTGAMLIAATGTVAAAEDATELALQVRAAEAAFARTMAERSYAEFVEFLADEAIFFSESGVLRGKNAVAAWQPYYEGPRALFSWQPESIEVLDSGTLAHSSGPVFAPDGRRVATFNSIWRREADGRWRIVFDKGYPYRE